jgi:hypothetical protein
MALQAAAGAGCTIFLFFRLTMDAGELGDVQAPAN